MLNVELEDLVNDYGDRIDNEHNLVIYSEDCIHSDLIGSSNVTRISEDYDWAEVEYHPWHNAVYVNLTVIEDDPEAMAEVWHLLRALDDYPVYDDSHHSDLEWEALNEYIENDLAGDLYYELGASDHDIWERIQFWIGLPGSRDVIFDHNDGSVDDCPINTEELARELPYWIGDLA